jgi:parvulin-like peptidyl-prolyl isomerase
VNGDQITLDEYQAELARYRAAVERELTAEDEEFVLNNLIDLTLLAQAAYSEGFQISDEDLQARLQELAQGDQPLEEWITEQGYTPESFQASLKRSLAAAWMRDAILEEVPAEAEQAHALQMLFYTSGQAYAALNQLQDGTNFAQLAASRDPQTNGDLGWFPRGGLPFPVLEEAVFNLEPGEYSDIIETEIGFHIVQLLEINENQPLSPENRQILQEQALQAWLERRRKLSTITITLP